MKLTIRYERLLSFIFLLPYLEGAFSFLTIYKNGAVFSVATLVLLVLSVLFLLIPARGRANLLISFYKLEFLLPLYLTISVLLMKERTEVSVSTYLWMISSIVFSLLFIAFFITRKLDIDVLLIDCIENFSALCVLLLVRAIFMDHLFIDFSSRFNPPGGGSVIFGYTCTVFLALTFYYYEKIRYPHAIITIFIISILGTMSRGAIWPAALIVLFFIMTFKKDSKNKMVVSIIILFFSFVAAIFLPIVLLQVAPRLLEASDYARQLTMKSVFETFQWYTPSNRIWGLGLGKVYQYQQWLTDNKFNTDVYYNNFFVFHGRPILVHPHNVYFYYLLETGIVSVILFVLPFFKYFLNAIRTKNFWHFILIFVVLFINFFDSVMIVEPGVASILYVTLFLLFYQNTQNNQ